MTNVLPSHDRLDEYLQFKQLELLKYQCLAFDFLEGDVKVVTTKDCVGCATEECIEYIHALTICGKF